MHHRSIDSVRQSLFIAQCIVIEGSDDEEEEGSEELEDPTASRAQRTGTRFRDGRRKIDYVLVSEEPVSLLAAGRRWSSASGVPESPCHQQQAKPTNSLHPDSPAIHHANNNNSKRGRRSDVRLAFLDNLRAQGVQVEEVSVGSASIYAALQSAAALMQSKHCVASRTSGS